MQLGLIGAGKMGQGMMQRWKSAGHEVKVFDPNHSDTVASLQDLVSQLEGPRIIWLMVPAGDPVRSTISDLVSLLEAEDIVIDGGNSQYQDAVKHHAKLAKRGVAFIDIGVSGGVSGSKNGYALMAGGDADTLEQIKPVIDALIAPDAYTHTGPPGSGHFVKMVHNAIEYGIMQSMGEGFDLLKNGPYPDLDLKNISHMWSHGTIIRSFLMELATEALSKDKDLKSIAGYVDDSGEGRWSVAAAVEHAVPFWANTAALYARFDSRRDDAFSAKLVAALRKEFGGHATIDSNQ